jgi:uncharacterized protein YjbI with pentapeptide repeats
LLKPRLGELQDGNLTASEILDGTAIRQLHLHRFDLSGACTRDVLFEQSRITKAALSSADRPSVHFVDVVIEDCDLSGLLTLGAQLLRTEWKSCRLTGWLCAESVVEHTLFESCKLDHANLRLCRFKSVVFRNCSLRSSDFHGASFNDVHFEGCTLDGAEFRACSVESLDLRGSNIREIRYLEGLKGATIDPVQLVELAPQLARIVGLHIC